MVVAIVSSRVDGSCVEWMWVEGLLGLDYSNSSDILSLLILNFNMSLILGLCNSTKNLKISFRGPTTFPINIRTF